MAISVEKNLDFTIKGLTEQDKGILRAIVSWTNEVADVVYSPPGNEAANTALRTFLSGLGVALDSVT